MLTRGDEYPIHQTAEPIAFSGTDRNFYDRYFFCGYSPEGEDYFALAFGVYPHLNIADAHFSVLRNGVQHCLHTSRLLAMERMELSVGPISIEVLEPLHTIRIIVADQDGISANLVFEGRAAPVQEPRFSRRQGPRMFMDLTRFTQNCRISGWVEVDGRRKIYGAGLGTRDRSWGVRPIGAADTQPAVPMEMPQFYWLWAPTHFPNLSLYAHVNEDTAGVPWNRRASLAMDGAAQGDLMHLSNDVFEIDWLPGKRHAHKVQLRAKDQAGRDQLVTWTPLSTFQMKGLGYGHPDWGHGVWKGELATAREDFRPDALDPLLIPNLHIQAVAKACHEGGGAGSDGIGIVEQMVVGPHTRSGFTGLNDGAP
jgi:hypothetical protein